MDVFEQKQMALEEKARTEHDDTSSSCAQPPAHEPPSQTDSLSDSIELAETDTCTVRNRLWASFKPSKARAEAVDYDFLPRKALTAILTQQTVESLLKEIPHTNCIDSVNITGRERRVKIFAILLLIEKTEHIGRFIQQGLTDNDLPLNRVRLQTCLREEAATIRAFLSRQYEVHVPVWDFSAHEIQEVKYDWEQKLPLLLKLPLGGGGQGKVFKVKIHGDHYETKTQSNRWECLHKGPEFALKEFTNENDFKDELKALKLFSQHESKHPNLVKALAAYTHGEKYFLMFPLAEGNLDQFWREPDSSFWDPLWLLTQCHGLTEGLHRVHQYKIRDPSSNERLRGRHGDIKPENVLRFMDCSTGKGRLVLSDFTLMRFHAEGSNKDTTTGRIGCTRTYRAPEVMLMQRVSQKYDVWSLGCVFLEFISCYLVGYEATRGVSFKGIDGRDYQSFDTVRLEEDYIDPGIPEDKYFLYKPGVHKVEVKTSVRKWFSYLHAQGRCSDALHDFLDVLQEHMLLPNPKSRWSIEKLLKRLTAILHKSRQHGVVTEYCRMGKPWATGQADQFPPIWDDEKDRRRRQPNFDTQRSTQSDSTSSTTSDESTPPSGTKHLANADGSRQDFGHLENLFPDDMPSSRSLGPGQVHCVVSATASQPQGDGDIRIGPIPQAGCSENHPSVTATSSRQTLSLPSNPVRMADQLLDPSHVLVDQKYPYRALMRINESIAVVSQQSPGIELLATPATSHCPALSEAPSTYTEDQRTSISSCTDLSILEAEDRFQQQNQSEESHGKDMSKSIMPSASLAGAGTIMNVAGRMNIDGGVEDFDMPHSGKKGLVPLWKKLSSLRRDTFRHILRKGQRRVGREGDRS